MEKETKIQSTVKPDNKFYKKWQGKTDQEIFESKDGHKLAVLYVNILIDEREANPLGEAVSRSTSLQKYKELLRFNLRVIETIEHLIRYDFTRKAVEELRRILVEDDDLILDEVRNKLWFDLKMRELSADPDGLYPFADYAVMDAAVERTSTYNAIMARYSDRVVELGILDDEKAKSKLLNSQVKKHSREYSDTFRETLSIELCNS